MLKELIKMANELDNIGLRKESDLVDSLIKKVSQSSNNSQNLGKTNQELARQEMLQQGVQGFTQALTPPKTSVTESLEKFKKDFSTMTAGANKSQPMSGEIVKKVTDYVDTIKQQSAAKGVNVTGLDELKKTIVNPTPPTPQQLDEKINNILLQNPKTIEAGREIVNLVKIANRLDSLGLTKEADILDKYISSHIKLAEETKFVPNEIFYCKEFPQIIISPSDNASSREYVRLSKDESGKFAFINSSKGTKNHVFNDHLMHKDYKVVGEEAIKFLTPNGVYVLNYGDGSTPLNNVYYNIVDGVVNQIQLKQGGEPDTKTISAKDFLIADRVYQKIEEAAFEKLKQDLSTPVVTQTPIDVESANPTNNIPAANEAELWTGYETSLGANVNQIKDKWLERSRSLKRYSTFENFKLWLKKRKPQYPQGMNTEQVLAELDKDIKAGKPTV